MTCCTTGMLFWLLQIGWHQIFQAASFRMFGHDWTSTWQIKAMRNSTRRQGERLYRYLLGKEYFAEYVSSWSIEWHNVEVGEFRSLLNSYILLCLWWNARHRQRLFRLGTSYSMEVLTDRSDLNFLSKHVERWGMENFPTNYVSHLWVERQVSRYGCVHNHHFHKATIHQNVNASKIHKTPGEIFYLAISSHFAEKFRRQILDSSLLWLNTRSNVKVFHKRKKQNSLWGTGAHTSEAFRSCYVSKDPIVWNNLDNKSPPFKALMFPYCYCSNGSQNLTWLEQGMVTRTLLILFS